jgi:hypothetical protein
MTPSRRASDSIEPLTLANKVGNGTPLMGDLIRVQSAVLASNAAVMGAVMELRKGVDQRLDREFADSRALIGTISTKLNGVCDEVVTIKNERRLADALAMERTSIAKQADAVAVQHSLSRNQRLGVMVAAVSGCGALALGVVTLLLRVAGWLS